MTKWRCKVCGYIHEGKEPPNECPICGVGAEEFVAYAENVMEQKKAKRWKCTVCDYVHTGDTPPAKCPLCGVGAEQFVLLLDDNVALTDQAVLTAGLDTVNSALDKISYGLYVVTSVKDNNINGQCCNTVFQLTSKPLRISVCLNKRNLTHDYLMSSGIFAVSMLGTEQMEAVRQFGYQSGRNVDKFANVEYIPGQNGCPILKDCLAYVEAKVLPDKTVDVGSHTLFIADVTAGRMVANDEVLTYSLYRSKK
ncbi:flavin reductase [Sporomusa acidovorans]|uniref:FMN reductase (NADH) RutF n=1 Tax=Sporomusa acidovorans (strain ATCC 49682 / DSM 3132 / Mol) TaxID=1123286 RepID=A0ABZ3J4A2_SPOA4|nr:flavin reductase [Sporomusa acidovorans]OZC15568.1 high molecular weight rubredoxin [Sporomusa acidovorans DSM 3132]SDE18532.1 NADH-FMN oxidoreductase RutF, flavin reductase (DIM6/NTAB) family [Sporomusa acidovorans]